MAGKYKQGARAGEYKLGTRAGGQAKGRRPEQGPGVKQRAEYREMQTP